MSLSARIRLSLEQNPLLTQSGMARACGISRASVNAWVSGKTESIDGKYLTTAASYLGVSPHWLATGEGAMLPRGTEGASSAGGGPTAVDAAPDLAQALEVVVAALAKVPMDSRKAVADDMGLLAMAPDSAETLARLAASLAPARQKSTLPRPESREFQPPVPPSMFLKNTEKT